VGDGTGVRYQAGDVSGEEENESWRQERGRDQRAHLLTQRASNYGVGWRQRTKRQGIRGTTIREL
jgi:hypothetical protein